MATQQIVRHRRAARGILLTPEHEILLQRVRLPWALELFWLVPGGGLEDGETLEQGLRRELYEEVGIAKFQIGPLVWRRDHTYTWEGFRVRQLEDYFIVHTPRFDPVMQDHEEANLVDCVCWWNVADLASAPDRFTPLSLASIVGNYLHNGPPKLISDVEIALD